ncbi:hypothetical protein B0T22DRAFT_198164 [Podospora appendiculata]|uniref:Uncharacterized protein n=1 Tax=Podospora appendiculata TaxID=314037 RepID=A0AAE0X451_9PEZI|nr:hypothetical protein B0T22DRAFT_198164 [Podospora appendiculata]
MQRKASGLRGLGVVETGRPVCETPTSRSSVPPFSTLSQLRDPFPSLISSLNEQSSKANSTTRRPTRYPYVIIIYHPLIAWVSFSRLAQIQVKRKISPLVSRSNYSRLCWRPLCMYHQTVHPSLLLLPFPFQPSRLCYRLDQFNLCAFSGLTIGS